MFNQNGAYFINEAFSYFKPIGASHEGKKWLLAWKWMNSPGVVVGDDMREFAQNFVKSISSHRHWDRQIV
jgi:catalase